jgi:[histone H3]-lysine36 N-dimethyltransferase SETMAR
VLRYLHALGKTWKYGSWVPHELAPHQLQERFDLSVNNLQHHATDDALEHLVTGDEKWVLYVNHTRKRQWLGPGEKGVPTPKPELHPEKVLLCCWWNVKGVIHWDLLPQGTTVTAQVYCEQLDQVAAKLRGKQRKVHFLHDNARPHIARLTQQKIRDLGWTVVPHPKYSPDLAPSDYHLFRSLAHFLEEKKFDDREDLKKAIETFFNEKTPEFYRDGIYKLRTRWLTVVDNFGGYIID